MMRLGERWTGAPGLRLAAVAAVLVLAWPALAAGEPAALTVDHWEIGLLLGSLGERRFPLHDGYVCANQSGPATLRAVMNKAVDPAALTAGAVVIIGQRHGDLSELVRSVSLEDGGTTLVITFFDSLPDADRYAISLAPGVKALDGAALAEPAVLRLARLVGNVTASGAVTAADVRQTADHVGQTVGPDTYRYDVTNSAEINLADVEAVRSRVGHRLP